MSTFDYTQELPTVEGNPSAKSIDDVISKPLDTKPGNLWKVLITITSLMLVTGGGALGWTFYKGIGVWGNNQPVGWGFDIVNFVFWVGIGHAGTLISAILFLLRQKWRKVANSNQAIHYTTGKNVALPTPRRSVRSYS